jgi:hypothetical protein
MIGEPDKRLNNWRCVRLSSPNTFTSSTGTPITDWSRRNPAKAEYVRRFACAVHGWRTKQPAGATPLDAFCDLRDRLESRIMKRGPPCRLVRREHHPVRQACRNRTAGRADGVRLLRAGRLSDAQRTWSSCSPTGVSRNTARTRSIGWQRCSARWSVEGQYGRLFDGVTNVSLHRRIAHFELGCIPEQAVELKAAIGLLISGLGRQHILALPRAKSGSASCFEELARFLDTPGGEQIVAEGYAQLRKHNCWCASIIQQYSRFKTRACAGRSSATPSSSSSCGRPTAPTSPIWPRTCRCLRTALDAIQRYPLPEQLPGPRRYSSLCYFAPTTQPPQCGTVRHYPGGTHAPASLIIICLCSTGCASPPANGCRGPGLRARLPAGDEGAVLAHPEPAAEPASVPNPVNHETPSSLSPARRAYLCAQWIVNDPVNTAVNAAVQAGQAANHLEVMRRWAEQLEQLNRQLRQLEEQLAVQQPHPRCHRRSDRRRCGRCPARTRRQRPRAAIRGDSGERAPSRQRGRFVAADFGGDLPPAR